MNFKKLGASLATGALLFATIAPASFASSYGILGTGAFSTNNLNVNHTTTHVVSQSNYSFVSTTVNNNANTGGNVNALNTGFGSGSTTNTGGVWTNTTVTNVTGVNVLLH